MSGCEPWTSQFRWKCSPDWANEARKGHTVWLWLKTHSNDDSQWGLPTMVAGETMKGTYCLAMIEYIFQYCPVKQWKGHIVWLWLNTHSNIDWWNNERDILFGYIWLKTHSNIGWWKHRKGHTVWLWLKTHSNIGQWKQWKGHIVWLYEDKVL